VKWQELVIDWLLEQFADGFNPFKQTLGGYMMTALTGNKQKIMVLVWAILLGCGYAFDCMDSALLAGGIASCGAFIAYGLSDMGYNLSKR